MQPFQNKFIEFALQHGALLFGTFTLKSGRVSPYFFNSGKFIDGAALAALGNFYADAIHSNHLLNFDVIFGPAYKGIQIATCCSLALVQKYHLSFPVSYNRKEQKNHGEGGIIVGADLTGMRVLLTDDVITAGTAIREAAAIIKEHGGTLVGIVTALDRQEVGQRSQLSANQEIAEEFAVPVISIITRDDLIDYVAVNSTQDLLHLQQYKEIYGC